MPPHYAPDWFCQSPPPKKIFFASPLKWFLGVLLAHFIAIRNYSTLCTFFNIIPNRSTKTTRFFKFGWYYQIYISLIGHHFHEVFLDFFKSFQISCLILIGIFPELNCWSRGAFRTEKQGVQRLQLVAASFLLRHNWELSHVNMDLFF